MLIKIAWRNIWRSRKRSLIILAAVGVGLWTGVFLMAFYTGMIEQRINAAISTELSHLQLHHPSFRNEYEIQYHLPQGREILQKISKDARVKVATGRVVVKGMIASASGSSGITINGVMPEEEQRLTNLPGKIVEGNYFTPPKTNEIILSKKLLDKLNLSLNRKVILTFQDKDGNLASSAFRVVGIFKTINGPYDDSNVFVAIQDLDALAGIPGELNEISVLLQSSEMLELCQRDFIQLFPETKVESWMQLSPELGLTVSVGDQMVYIFMGIILLALAFGIVNTMMMAVLERTKEIGMLMALGMNKLKVFIMILLETFFLILAGCPGGLLAAFATLTLTHRTGIDLSFYGQLYSSFGYSPIVHPVLKFQHLEIIMLLVLITALISALFPARMALRLKPAESLKK